LFSGLVVWTVIFWILVIFMMGNIRVIMEIR